MIVEINRGNGMTELKELKEIGRGVKELLLVLSVILPVVLGFIFTDRLLESGVGFLIYWGIYYAWLMLFLYANSSKRKDRRAGKQKRSCSKK